MEKPVVNVNSPAGDNQPTIVTVDMAKCHVIEAEVCEIIDYSYRS